MSPLRDLVDMNGPLIEGSSFRLRPPKEEDAGTMITWFEDQEVTAWLSLGFPPSLEDERRWLSSVATSSDTILWVIEHEGRAVGTTAR
jgi:RimJ/RimL family protein N-acetyltransferase